MDSVLCVTLLDLLFCVVPGEKIAFMMVYSFLLKLKHLYGYISLSTIKFCYVAVS